jgi:predicted Zn-dependent protease
MKIKPAPIDQTAQAIYAFYLTEFPHLVGFIQKMVNEGYTPEEIEDFAEAKIGVCETSYSAKIIARYLIDNEQE